MIVAILATAGSALVLTQSSLAAPIRDGLTALGEASDLAAQARSDLGLSGRFDRIIPRLFRGAAKLVSCPMCAGFWLGLAWAAVFGSRGIQLVALGFAGSLASALLVALWLALSEASLALGLWRYLRTPAPADQKRNVLLTIKTSGKWPTAAEIELRDEIERDLAANGIRRIEHDCGAGTINIILPEVQDTASVVSTCAWIVSTRGIDDRANVSVS